jgi:hypothetical protein
MTAAVPEANGASQLRLKLLAVAAVVGPLLFVIGSFIEPGDETDTARQTVATVADSPSRWFIALAVIAVGSALTVALAVIAPRVAPGRGAGLTTFGAILLAIGGVAFFGGIYMYGAVLQTLVDDGNEQLAIAAQDVLDDGW